MAAIPHFARGSYQAKSLIAGNDRTINWFPELVEVPGEKARAVLYPTPGYEQVGATLAAGAFRGLFTTGHPEGGAAVGTSRTFGVVGPKFYEFSVLGTVQTDRTSVPVALQDNWPVTICANGAGGNQLFFAASRFGYCYDLGTDTLTEELASGCDMVASLDGFIISLNAVTSTIRISGSFDATVWESTQIFQRTAAGDKWISLLVADARIYLIGELTSETLYNTGASPFPFEPDTVVIPFGTPARHSPAEANGAVIFLAQSVNGFAGVMRLDGLAARKISTLALDVAIGNYAVVTDAIGETYTEEGHTFYLLTFPTEGITWAFDFTTNEWHERGHWNRDTGLYEALTPQFHTYNFGDNLVGDRTVGKLWRQSTLLSTDTDGLGFRRLRRFPAAFFENKLLFYDRLEVLAEMGLGTLGEDDPVLELEYSNDGGKTFPANAGFAGIGSEGEYLARCYWTQLGSSRQRMWQIVSTVDIPVRLIAAFQNVRAGVEVGR